jgi:hypothetical protein
MLDILLVNLIDSQVQSLHDIRMTAQCLRAADKSGILQEEFSFSRDP